MPYPDDPALRAAAPALFGAVWPSLPRAIARAGALGADWFDVSTPFFRFHDGVPIAHVGVIEIPLRIGSRDVVVAGVHAVCARPDHRGRGHMRAAMQEALQWIDARHDTAVLWTSEPEIYTRFGFARCEEHVFTSPASGAAASAERGGVRALSLENPEDARRLLDLLARRAPVSEICGARDPGWLFLIDLCIWATFPHSVWHLADLDCMVVGDDRGGALHIYDVIAPEVPPLPEIAARLGGGAAVSVYFTPDRVGGQGLTPSPSPLEDLLMVRGRGLSVPGPFALSPLSHC